MIKKPENFGEKGNDKLSLKGRVKEIGSKAKKMLGLVKDRICSIFDSDNLGKDKDGNTRSTYMKDGKLGIVIIKKKGELVAVTEAKYDDFMLCGKNFIRARIGEVWRLLDENYEEVKIQRDGKEEILEAKDVNNIDKYLDIEFGLPAVTSGGIIFDSGFGWGVVTDKGPIVQENCNGMHLRSIDVEGREYDIAVGLNGDEEVCYISVESGFISKDLESQIENIKKNIDNSVDKKNSIQERVKKLGENVKAKLKEYGNDIKQNFESFSDAYMDMQYNRYMKERFSLKGGTKKGFSYMKKRKVGIWGILEAKYENVAPCSDNYIWVMLGKKRGLVDTEGKMVIEPKYDRIKKDGRVMIAGKYGLVNTQTGKEILEPKYDKVLLFKGYSVAVPVLKNNYGLVSKIDGSIIKNIGFDGIREDSKNGTLILSFLKGGMPDDVVDCSPYKEAA